MSKQESKRRHQWTPVPDSGSQWSCICGLTRTSGEPGHYVYTTQTGEDYDTAGECLGPQERN